MTQEQEQLIVDMKNELSKLQKNLTALEDVQKRLQFMIREVSDVLGVSKYERKIQSND